jgi:hypothetical protein
MQMKNLSDSTAKLPGPLHRTAAFIATAALLGLVLMFSAVLLVIILIGGAITLAYLWWKTRDLRKQMRDFPPSGEVMGGVVREGGVVKGEVIEGEVIRVVDSRDQR